MQMDLKESITERSEMKRMTNEELASVPLDVAVAPKRTTKTWRNTKMTWTQMLERLKNPTRTGESVAEFFGMKKSERDEVKDQGGFVGGLLRNGARKRGCVEKRQIVALDADNIPKGIDFPAICAKYFGTKGLIEGGRYMAYALYTTHSHKPGKPRFRLLVPLMRAVTEEEYEPIARYVASSAGIMEYLDPTTYEPVRFMYWPSASKEAEYIYYGQDGRFESPDVVEDALGDWRDASRWPIAKSETVAHAKTTKKLGDPREKPGLIGAFCRAYTVEEAIETFLPDVYAKVDGTEDRYTYKAGSTAGGMIVYDDGLHAYSHHATDPISGLDVNAFDLVRIHLFGAQDEDIDEDTPVNKRPSYVAMTSLAQKDEKVKAERNAALKKSFSDSVLSDGLDDEAELDWIDKLQRQKGGRIIPSAYNFLLILHNANGLKGSLGYNDFSGRVEVLQDLPWRKHNPDGFDVWTDADDAQLRNMISIAFEGLQGKQVLDDAVTEVVHKNRFHPVRDCLKSLKWDGKKRLENLLIYYLGAEDAPYVREVTTLFFKAAVARVFHPGIKFDQCLIIRGPQGIGKSTVLARMGGKWYQDTLPSIKGKDAMEALQGYWIVELSELQAATRAENEEFKAFISRQSDKFRAPYGHRTEEHPRQCVFAATTNEQTFIRDQTGGRRFWIVVCQGSKHNAFLELTGEEVAQCWAEAYELYKQDKNLFPSTDTEQKLKELVEAHTEGSEKLGLIQGYLDSLLPEEWDGWDIDRRREYLDDVMSAAPKGIKRRERVCTMEIWCECFGNSPRNLRNMDAREINSLLAKMPGWKPYEKGVLRFPIYGRQRAYIREGQSEGKSVGSPKKSVDTKDLDELF